MNKIICFGDGGPKKRFRKETYQVKVRGTPNMGPIREFLHCEIFDFEVIVTKRRKTRDK